jgi:hypothetical protein
MSGIIAFDDLFPLKPNPTALDRVFGFDAEDGKSRAFSIQSILDLIDETPVTWGEITGKPSTFAPADHSFGSHSNVSTGVDSAPDGTFVKKVAGQYQAVAVDFYGVSNPPPPDPSVPDPVRGITATKIAQWDQAYGWGNHAGQYRPIAWVPSWGEVTGKPSTFAPAAHTLGSHSDAAALATATEGQLVRKAAVGFEAFTPNYYSPSSPPPPDASVPDFVRDFTPGQFAGYEEKLLEWVGMPNGAIPAILGGVPVSSEIVGTFTENPFDPITEAEDYEAWVTELLYLTAAKRIKAPDAVDADDYATLGQVPVLFDEDLEAIANAAPHSALNPFATMSDVFSKSIFDLLQDGATNGQAVVWSDANMRWEPGTVAGGGGADTNAVHYNAADGKSASEKAQARENLALTSMTPQVESGSGELSGLTATSSLIVLTGTFTALSGIYPTGFVVDHLEIVVINATGSAIPITANRGGTGTRGFATAGVIENGSYVKIKYNSTVGRWLLISQPYVITEGNLDQDITGTKTFRGKTNSLAARFYQSNSGLNIVQFIGSGDSVKSTIDGSGGYSTASTITAGQIVTNSNKQSSFQNTNSGLSPIRVINSNGTVTFWAVSGNGRIVQGVRSGASNEQIRRDEQGLYYQRSENSLSGSVNDYNILDGFFNVRFVQLTELTGIANGEKGRVIIIQNFNSVDLDLLHESTLSVAVNRMYFISLGTLSIPPKGKVTLIYSQSSRWELLSKNF